MLHVPVLLEESLDFLLNDLSGSYLDLTFGRGSHSQEILNRLSPSGKLFAVDRDLEAVSYGKDNITDKRFEIFHANYSQIDLLFSGQQFNGILLDLGTCSTHLDNHSRGFSFQGEGPLDMRMDTSQGFSAASFLQYSSSLRVVRAANTSSVNAVVSGSALRIKNTDHYQNGDGTTGPYSNGSANVGEWAARTAGAWGNNLKVSVCPSATAYEAVNKTTIGIKYNRFLIIVDFQNTILF